MPFFPDSDYGLSYLAALCIACVLSWYGGRNEARSIVLLMIGHWLSMRSIDVLDKDNYWYWSAQDLAIIVALMVFTRSVYSYAMASVFFVGLLFDQWCLISKAKFESGAAVGEAIGYLAMIIMVGGAWHGIRLFGPFGRVFRFAADVFHVEKGSAISPRSTLPARDFSHGAVLAQEDGVK